MEHSEELIGRNASTNLTTELKWLCHLVLMRQLIDQEGLARLLSFEEDDLSPVDLAQTAIDEGLCDNVNEVNQALQDAWQFAKDGLPAPTIRGDGRPDLSQAVDHFCDADSPSEEQALGLMMQILACARQQQVSDVHITAGNPPSWRRWGIVERLSDRPLSRRAADALNLTLVPERCKAKVVSPDEDLTVAVNLPDATRCRINVVHHCMGTAGTYRLVPERVRPLGDLGFTDPGPIERLLDHHSGILLVAGPSGAGKTTTLASLVQTIAARRLCHIISLENPLEIVHEKSASAISQREVGRHIASYPKALKAALREDPDVIVIGELHDAETIELALTAAETGHLVLGTMHASNSAGALNRILSSFPPSQTSHVRGMMSESLRGIICQQFLPSTDGRLVLAYELLVNTHAVANLVREGRTFHLEQVMQTGMAEGMQTMDRSVISLYRAGRIDKRTAKTALASRQAEAELDGNAGAEAREATRRNTHNGTPENRTANTESTMFVPKENAYAGSPNG